MRYWKPLLVLVVVVLALLWNRQAQTPVPAAQPNAPAASASRDNGATLPSFLPPEAHDTLALIARGGPFPHSQDGVVFGNYEGLLPKQPRGYYHEYTVETPGASTRGTRRIITGGTPPEVYYYTDDHYRSFRRFTLP
ncbi:ribonuclease domain-containing protein [Dyella agri]|uniref:Ribonuclease n=1 Tax=Dyella agri TaxID=1926869 RepID=A0ABW8KGJ1_9GAMM